MDEPRHIIVIGASAGALPVTARLLSTFPSDLDAAVFVVIHLAQTSIPGIMLNILKKQAKLICKIATHEEDIKKGYVYLAPAHHHLFLKKNTMVLTSGPTENRFRPSIDVLFRSAAAAYTTRVIGIILTGLMDDGASGMVAIKRCGGICIVQEPAEAEFDAMPLSVLDRVDVDYRVSINDMSFILQDVFARQTVEENPVPKDIATEAELTGNMLSSINRLAEIGQHSEYTCPDCGGNLWKIMKDPVGRYRCHTGHAYTRKSLLEKQTESLSESLWVSIRMMEEQRALLMHMARELHSRGDEALGNSDIEKANVLKLHVERLKVVVLTIENQ